MTEESAQTMFAKLLKLMVLHNDDRELRNWLVPAALNHARDMMGLTTGHRVGGADASYRFAFIVLPEYGQVSWRIPAQYETFRSNRNVVPYDGHTNEDKLARCMAYADSLLISEQGRTTNAGVV